MRTYPRGHFSLAQLIGAKRGRLISVCIPARDEQSTLAGVIEAAVLGHLPTGSGLVDDLVVVDDGSSDSTAAIARSLGARVVGRRPGGDKGGAMAAGLEACCGEIVVYLDADVHNANPGFVESLVGPLLLEDANLVKGFYERPIDGLANGGGRVTELLARPLIDALFKELASVRQPLAGETAAQRWVLEKVGLAPGYGVEIALLIDVARDLGVESIAQVDLGVRIHRNRPLSELRPQANDVLAAALLRAGAYGDADDQTRPDSVGG
ncbi:MAG: glucosyl-3-phosphoglycerate synthase [Acidimicrobiales bacterium]